MKLIPIYSAEASVSGLAEKIRANSSIAYYSPLTPSGVDNLVLNKALAQFAKASTKDIQDLFPTQSILATTSWNRNDDIFSVVDTWAARHTPINKPTNLDHEESKLVGHMTGTWAIDDDGKLIDESSTIDDLPNRFHLCNSAVIYTHWQDEELQKRTSKLIEEIKAGTKYVSMECFFCNFDYGVKSSSGEFYIVPRDKSTAFLTKYLRAYEGSGEYEGYAIGRVMRDFVFSGKGYVDKPANPDSIIFASAEKLDFSKAIQEYPFNKSVGVSLSYEGISKAVALVTKQETENLTTMADNNDVLVKQLEEVKAALKASETARAEQADKLTKSEAAKWEAQIADLNTKLEAAKKCSDEEKKAAEKAKSELEASVAKLAEVEKAKAELEKTLEVAKAEKVRASRVSTLVEGGIEKAEAEKKVEVFANLSDDQFAVIAAELVVAAKAKKGDKPMEDEKNEKKGKAATEAAEAEAALASAKASADTAPVITSDNTVASDEVRQAIASRFSKKYKKTSNDE